MGRPPASGIPRRSIDEIAVQYALEPSLKDVFVEGASDRDFYSWFLREIGAIDVSVYAISDIDVPRKTLERYKLTAGNRQRLIAFSKELEIHAGWLSNVLCIVDSDFDFLLGTKNDTRYVVRTDVTSLEIYFFSAEVLSKLLALVLGEKEHELVSKQYLSKLTASLTELFWIRAACAELKLDIDWLDPKSSLDSSGTLNVSKFLGRLLDKNAMRHHREALAQKIKQLRDTFSNLDVPKRIHGHDFVELLYYVANEKFRKNKVGSPELVYRVLLGLSELRFFVDFDLFKQLIRRFG